MFLFSLFFIFINSLEDQVITEPKSPSISGQNYEIIRCVFHAISSGPALTIYSSATTCEFSVQSSTFYDCSYRINTIFELGSNIILDFYDVSLTNCIAEAEGVILNLNTDIDAVQKIEYLSAYNCKTQNYWCFQLSGSSIKENIAYLKNSNFTQNSILSQDTSETYFGFFRFKYLKYAVSYTHFYEQTCNYYGLIYVEGPSQNINIGSFSHINIIKCIDISRTLFMQLIVKFYYNLVIFNKMNVGITIFYMQEGLQLYLQISLQIIFNILQV